VPPSPLPHVTRGIASCMAAAVLATYCLLYDASGDGRKFDVFCLTDVLQVRQYVRVASAGWAPDDADGVIDH
jgi:hypothetical protein